MSDEPRAIEPVPVQLTRIEGVLNLVAYQMTEVKDDVRHIAAEVEDVKRRVGAVEIVQAQSTGAMTSWRSWLPVVIAAASLAVAAAVALTR